MKTLSSLQNPLVKHWVKLRKQQKYREEKQAVFVEGKKLLSEIRKPIFRLILREDVKTSLKAEEVYSVPPFVFEKISGLNSPEGIAAEITLPKPSNLSEKTLLLALDQVNDPGNLGTLMRTAVALGFEGLFLIEKTADLFNEKALRAAKGATFKLPFKQGTYEELQTLIQNGFHLYIADLNGSSVTEVSFKKPLILLLGNEARGISKEMRKMGTQITIPMKDQMESLNVAVAGGILMHHMTV